MTYGNFLSACLLVFLTFTGTSLAGGLPLVESFESGESIPDRWRKGASVPGVQYVYDKNNASAGKRSLSLQKSANRYFPIAQWTRTMEHDGSAITVEVNAKVKAVKASKAIIEVQFYDGSSQMIGKEWVSYIGQKQPKDRPASHSWKDYTGKADVPAGTKQLAIALQIYGPGKVWFDEVKVNEVGANRESMAKASANDADTITEGVNMPVSKVRSLQLDSGAWTRFVTMSPMQSAKTSSAGYRVLFVLPGGDGSVEFQPFVQNICYQALGGDYLVIQLIAPPQIVWPTSDSRSRFATTEASIAGVLNKLSEKVAIDRSKVFALAWSSSGPAAYTSLLKETSPLKGAFVAMSVFKPKSYPPLKNANGKRVYLLHSPEDKTCPYGMAKHAESELRTAGATVQLTDYAGGHGWHGDVMNNIRTGMNWLNGAR